jgi:hypothetical protein
MTRLKLWLAAIVAALAGVLAVYAKGRADAKAKRKADELQAHKDTVERVLDEQASADPVDDIRKRLRERARKP